MGEPVFPSLLSEPMPLKDHKESLWDRTTMSHVEPRAHEGGRSISRQEGTKAKTSTGATQAALSLNDCSRSEDGQLICAKRLVLCIQWGFVDCILQAYRFNSNLVHTLIPELLSRMLLGLGTLITLLIAQIRGFHQTSVGCGRDQLCFVSSNRPGSCSCPTVQSWSFHGKRTRIPCSSLKHGFHRFLTGSENPTLLQNVLRLLSLY